MRWPGLPREPRAALGELGALVVCLGLLGASKMVLVICIRHWTMRRVPEPLCDAVESWLAGTGSATACAHALPCRVPALTAVGLKNRLNLRRAKVRWPHVPGTRPAFSQAIINASPLLSYNFMNCYNRKGEVGGRETHDPNELISEKRASLAHPSPAAFWLSSRMHRPRRCSPSAG